MNTTDVSASVVTFNNADTIAKCAESLLRFTAGVPFSLSVYDNGSTDGTVAIIKNIPGVTLVENGGNLGFGAAHNLALEHTDSKYHAFINPDITVNSDVISALAEYLDVHPDVVLITPMILNPDGMPQRLPRLHPKMKYLISGRLPFFKKLRDRYTMADRELTAATQIEFCTGCFMMGRTAELKAAGGFDSRYFMYMEDADLSRVMGHYGKIMLYPGTSATHLWNRDSTRKLKYLFIHINSAIKYWKKWRKS